MYMKLLYPKQSTLIISPQSLHGLHPHQRTQLLEDDELNSRRGCKARPDGHESSPEGQRSFIFYYLDEAVSGIGINLGVSRLVHQSRSDHIERRHGARHEESRSHRRYELRDKRGLGQACVLDHVSLGLVVACHLRSVQHHRPQNVRVDSPVETADTLMLEQILGGSNDGRRSLAFCRHHLGLENIERVAGERPKSTRGTSGGKLLQKCRVLGRRATERDLARLVKPEAE
mmetsp:Transcript_37682/g.90180  ORF Transcript_37682/g.90180 Transcript_37682/m.90180 type:complete len:230 (-) Transcript_37682:487-1176(-)